ncbi:hypothetical protein [Sphingomonas nostoxanthinifaciens]|uniref:hypothetical protein n=1 Tax=Sphingomonas nostoxanthinifaciens TaxID=2872652 RepID=UPI001CC1E203|nr:hypothetical protein [Sphingomonas nostoxanthinifaciens]UAK25881.1 hypothetical protein K8P63_07100 [Sphingomonas nostoxanthinifaciens]
MTETTMIERVARSLCGLASNPPGGHDASPSMRVPEGDVDWRSFITPARAVIAAMREPEDSILRSTAADEVMNAKANVDPWIVFYADLWRHMIDAALAEER